MTAEGVVPVAKVLTTASKVECGHSGQVSTAGVDRLRVGGAAVLTATSVAGNAVTGCRTVPATNPNGTPKDVPCTAVGGVTATNAARLTVGGTPVLVEPLEGSTNGLLNSLPTAALTGSAGQTRVTGR
jgi:hypothetical protein